MKSKDEEDPRAVGLSGPLRHLGEEGGARNSAEPVADDLASHYSALSEDRCAAPRAREAAMLYSVAEEHVVDGDADEALTAAADALKVFQELKDGRGAADALRIVVEAHRARGRLEEAMDVATSEMKSFKDAGDQHGEASMLLAVGKVHVSRGRPAEALESLSAAATICRAAGDRKMEASTLLATASAQTERGDATHYEEALKAANDALDIAVELGDKDRQARAHYRIARTRLAGFAGGDALHAAEKAQAIFQDLGRKRFEGTALLTIAEAHRMRESPRLAVRFADRAAALFREIGYSKGLGDALATSVRVHVGRGQQKEAVRLAKREVALFRANGDKLGEAYAKDALAEAFLGRHQNKWALRAGWEAMELVRDMGDQRGHLKRLLTVAMLHIVNKQDDWALEAVEKAETIAKKLGDRHSEAVARYTMIHLYLFKREHSDAVNAADEARAIFQERGDKKWEASTLVSVCQVHRDMGDNETTKITAEEAKAIFEEVGDKRGAVAALITAAEASLADADYDAAMATAEQACSIAQEMGYKQGHGMALRHMAAVHLARGEPTDAVRLAIEAKTLMRRAEDRKGEASVLQLLSNASIAHFANIAAARDENGEQNKQEAAASGRALREVGKTALREAREAAAYAKRSEDKNFHLDSLRTYAQALLMNGKLGQALDVAGEAVTIAREIDDKGKEAAALVLCAEAHIMDQKAQPAFEAGRKGLKIFQEIGDAGGAAYANQVLEVFLGREVEGGAEEDEYEDDDDDDEPGGTEQYYEEVVETVATAPGLDPGNVLEQLRKAAENAIAGDELYDDSPLMDSGLDSLASVAFRNELQGTFKMTMPAALIFDYPSLRQLTTFIVDESKSKGGAPQKKVVRKAIAPGQGGGDKPRRKKKKAAASVEMPMESIPEEVHQEEVHEVYSSVAQQMSTWEGLDPSTVLAKIQSAAKNSVGFDEDLYDDSPLMDSGLDSLASVQFRNDLQGQFKMTLPAALIFDYPSVRQITSYIVEESKAKPPPGHQAQKLSSPAPQKRMQDAEPRATQEQPAASPGSGVGRRSAIPAWAKLPPPDLKVKRPCIVGTWDSWAAKQMKWKEDERCYYSNVKLGSNGWESFQILCDGQWKRCLHPDRKDASPHVAYKLCGPDDEGHNMNWTIGENINDDGAEGASYRILLYINEDGSAKSLDWEKVGEERASAETATDLSEELGLGLGEHEGEPSPSAQHEPSKACPWSIVGTWNNWDAREMAWHAKSGCYRFKVKLGSNTWESFQILGNGEWRRCLHPDKTDGCPYSHYELCGPDDNGHGNNWTIGRHPIDKGDEGSRYMVRLFVDEDGDPKKVDWLVL